MKTSAIKNIKHAGAIWRVLRPLAALAFCLLVVLTVYPTLLRAAVLFEQWRDDRVAISNAAATREGVVRMESVRASLVARRDSLLRVPPQESYSLFLDAIRLAADEAGVDVSGIRPGEPQHTGQFALIPLQIEFAGSYVGIGRFADLLERSDYLMMLQAMRLEQAAEAVSGEASFMLVVEAGGAADRIQE